MKIIKKENPSRPHICWGSLFCTNLTQPTGALDQTSGKEVLKLFRELNDMGNTIVMITHDLGVAQSAKRIVRIVDGQLQE